MAKVSVIIPARNADRYIDKCLGSLKAQSFKDFEVVVADDCSTDKTAEVISRFDVTMVTLAQQSGPGRARNLAVQKSAGEMLAFTDADVVLPEHWLSNFLEDMELQQVKCVAAGYCGGIGDAYIQRFALAELEHRRKDFPEFVNTFPANNFFCKREVFLKVHGFPENYKAASNEDMVFSYKVSREYKVYWDRANGVFHHFRDSWKKYLAQQYRFAKDTVLMYIHFPRLFLLKTHQGRSLYMETLVVLFSLASAVVFPLILFAGAGAIFLMNLDFFLFAKNKYRLPIIKTFLTVLVRDFVISLGAVAGIITLAGRK